MKKILVRSLLVLSIIFLLGAFSCGQGISQSDYDKVKSQLNETLNQLKTLQDKLAAAAGTLTSDNQSAALNKTIDALKKQNDAYTAQIASLDAQKKVTEARMNDLTAKNADLQKQIAALSKAPEEITAEKVEQAIFAIINQDRASNNVTPLSWGVNLYSITKQNSQHMSETGKYEYSTWSFFQQIFMAASYSSIDGIAKGALQVWKANQYQYEHGIISKAFKYCAVGAYKSGDVVFITFMAADVP